MPISYKHKIYTTLGTPTELSGNVVSTTDSAGVPAKDYTVKGKTIVWNQLLDKSKYPATTTTNGVTFTNNGDGTITVNGTASSDAIYYLIKQGEKLGVVGHKYFLCGCPSGGSYNTYRITASISLNGTWKNGFSDDGTAGGNISPVLSSGEIIHIEITIKPGYTANNLIFKPQLFDLTQMFGAGNEPTTVAQFRAMFPDDYYPYNAGELKSIIPEAVETKNQYGETKRANIPTLKYFPDGMRSAGSVYDEINFLSQKAIKRIGVQNDISTFPWVNGGSNWWGFRVSSVAGLSWKKFTQILCAKYEWKGAVTDATMSTDIPNGLYCSTDGEWINIKDSNYSTTTAFKSSLKDVPIYYELATPVETAITPPLQALQTFKGFTSFSAPNSLMQNGPLSVTYYAEGGASPEKGWLTSYKRKLYMGRTIEWNQLFNKEQFPNEQTLRGVTFTPNSMDGTITVNGTMSNADDVHFNFNTVSLVIGHKYLFGTGLVYTGVYKLQLADLNASVDYQAWSDTIFECAGGSSFVSYVDIYTKNTISNLIFRPQLFDLTQMFGAGNEPATPAEFWSYFDHKLYPYNTGETQPLFKISRKSQWGALPKHYTARWDKVNAAMVRLNDAASFPTNITNFAYRGSVNANYSNPFDNIYPWSGIKLCNISIDLYRNLVAGDSITKCVTAWEGDVNFSYNDANGVWRYRPEFWGKSWEDDTYRYFDVTDQNVPGSNYVHYPEAIVGRWHGRNETLTIGGSEKTCLVPSVGMPAKRIAMSTLHTYAKNYGATIDSIYSIDADTLLCVVEFATMNTQNAIGKGVSNLYRESSDLIQEGVTNSTTVKVLADAGSTCCIPGAVFDIGTSNGGTQVGSFTVVSATPNVVDAQYLDVTLDRAVTVTGANYWSVHGLVNVADEAIGSKSGYIGENGKCNSYYRGIVMFGNMWFYILGAYENKDDHHIWIANSGEEADNYDALDTTAHYDTGRVLPTAVGYTKKLALLSRSGLLSIPAFCVETGGNSSNPVGDYFYNGVYTWNTVLLLGGCAPDGSYGGAFFGAWGAAASTRDLCFSARPRLKNP